MEYLSLLNYAPRGKSQISQDTKFLKGHVKRADPKLMASLYVDVIKPNISVVQEFLSDSTSMMPIPGSALVVPGGLWAADSLANQLLGLGLGKNVLPWLTRHTPIRSSSSQPSAKERPTIAEQMATIRVKQELVPPESITLIDDVLTLGRTSVACERVIKEVYPNVPIKLLTIMRTHSLPGDQEATSIVNLDRGTVVYNPTSGKCFFP